MYQPRILVVDDYSDTVEMISFALKQEGYQVVSAANGWEALGAIRATEPDLVVLDVILPKENGYRVSRFVKTDIQRGVYQKDIPIMLLTARPVKEPGAMKTMVEFSQADHVMYKPFDMERLIAKVKELLECQEH
jgi:CheY-like chemotaxis protein